jgi:hypothetical protein
MAYGTGTAPRLVKGIWTTRTGRRLTPDGQAYWHRQLALGVTDGRGHTVTSSLVRGAAARQPATPRLEAVQSKPKPDSPATLAKRRAEVIASQALKKLGPDIAASRRAAPGPAVSGYHLLSATLGRDLAGLTPGTLTASGHRPGYSKRGVALDLLGFSPYGRGRAVLNAAEALKAGKSAAEVARAAKSTRPWRGPLERTASRVYVAEDPDLSSGLSVSGDPYDTRYTLPRIRRTAWASWRKFQEGGRKKGQRRRSVGDSPNRS